ncbi:MAG TPA: NfeD family protein [Phycisphaerae bacterium]|nr:NfeD family protein [Phycisphaerae bacterium]
MNRYKLLKIMRTGGLTAIVAWCCVLLIGPASGLAIDKSSDNATTEKTSAALLAKESAIKDTAFDETAPTERFKNGFIIPIRGEINDVMFESLERRIETAKQADAKLIVFELDTPGGAVSSALDICDLIKSLTEIKTVAWVHTEAYSAGSMISLACDEIVMSTASTIGDCGVILGGPTGPSEVPEELRAKAESPVIEEFRDSANRRDYDLLLCESMVVKERVVYWVENINTGQRKFVDEQEKIRLVGGSTDKTPFAASDNQETEYEWKLVTSYTDIVTGKEIKITQPVVPATELLTMRQSKAAAFGFCKAICSSPTDLKIRYNVDEALTMLTSNWSERVTSWLTSMPVRIFLLALLLLGAYVEFHTPGVGLAGLVSLICLAIFVGAPYMTGLANVWEIVIVFIGFGLIALEVFVIPGFGVAGISGMLCVVVGLLATFIPEEPGRTLPIYWPQFEPGLQGLKIGVTTLGSALGASIVGMILISRMLPHISWLHGAMPLNPTAEEVGLVDPYNGYAREGDVGLVESPLRPAGKVRFGNMLVDVVTQGMFVEPGTEVEVCERQGNRVVVRPINT